MLTCYIFFRSSDTEYNYISVGGARYPFLPTRLSFAIPNQTVLWYPTKCITISGNCARKQSEETHNRKQTHLGRISGTYNANSCEEMRYCNVVNVYYIVCFSRNGAGILLNMCEDIHSKICLWTIQLLIVSKTDKRYSR